MKEIIEKHWPLLVGIIVLWIVVAVLLILSVKQNQGHLVYALDDPYIHMAIAKNFANHGVWSINKEGFVSSSSSLLWTLLLAFTYLMFGVSEITPFILNILFATLLVFIVYHLIKKYIFRNLFLLGILLSLIFFTSLPALIFCGQEHTLQILIVISFVYFSAQMLSKEYMQEKKSQTARTAFLLALAPLVTMIRYEGVFLILIVCILSIVFRKWFYCVLLGICGALPILIYGMISISNRWFFLPNSILLKGNVPYSLSSAGIIEFLRIVYKQLLLTPHLLFLLLLALLVLIFHNKTPKQNRKDAIIMTIIFVAVTIFHTLFAKVGWFYRYESYLVALGLVVVGIGIELYLLKRFPLQVGSSLAYRNVATIFLIGIFMLPFIKRTVLTLTRIPQATTNIYEQQYQMGLFLKNFYQGVNVAANDVGAICYLADIKCLDLWGLTNLEVLQLKMKQKYSTPWIHDLSVRNKVRIAIVYESWFKIYGGIPPWWTKVAQWRILNNVVCSDDKVTFYAVDPSETDNLVKNIKAFSSFLPKFVLQSWWSTK